MLGYVGISLSGPELAALAACALTCHDLAGSSLSLLAKVRAMGQHESGDPLWALSAF
jgi:hypothetical protein